MQVILNNLNFSKSGFWYLALSLLCLTTWQQGIEYEKAHTEAYIENQLDIYQDVFDAYDLGADHFYSTQCFSKTSSNHWSIYLDSNSQADIQNCISVTRHLLCVTDDQLRPNISAQHYSSEDPPLI